MMNTVLTSRMATPTVGSCVSRPVRLALYQPMLRVHGRKYFSYEEQSRRCVCLSSTSGVLGLSDESNGSPDGGRFPWKAIAAGAGCISLLALLSSTGGAGLPFASISSTVGSTTHHGKFSPFSECLISGEGLALPGSFLVGSQPSPR